jgi:hypothetical protein
MDLVSTESDAQVRLWTLSFLVPDLFVAVVSGLGSYDLAWRPGKREVFVLLAAGGLLFLSLERLTYGISAGFVQELRPGDRLEITAMGLALCVGIWAVSYSLRVRAER